MKSRTLRRAGALLLALTLACSLLTLPVSAVDQLAVSLTPNSVSLKLGSSNTSSTLTPTITAGGTALTDLTGVDLVWSIVSGNDVISLSGGTVSALKEGNAEVSLTVTETTDPTNTASASCSVTVAPADTPVSPQVTIQLNPESATLPLGESLTVTAEVTPEGAPLDWKSSDSVNFRLSIDSYNPRKVTVTTSSRAEPKDRLTLTALSREDPSAYAICVIEVIPARAPQPSSVLINTTPTADGKNYVDIGTDDDLTLSASVSPAGVAEEDGRLTWSSSDTSVARVNASTGKVTGVSPGEATITVTTPNGKIDQREIEVSGLLLSYVKKSTSGGRGETISLTEGSEVDIPQYRDITVSYQAFGNARNKNITWESSNNSVAQVLGGRVTGHYPGSNVTITASADGTSCQSSFKVRVSEDVADAINVNMGSEPSYAFSGILSQLNARSQSKAGAPLDYVYSLRVSTENGILYYRYTSSETPSHGIGGTERYYYQPSGQGQMALRDVSFVPLPGFSGTAVVDYSAASTSGATFTGTIRIEASASSGGLSYSTQMDQPLALVGEHFSSVCKSRNGQALHYVTFTQPASSRGALYYNYSPNGQYSPKVDANTRYYLTSNPRVDNITFVPAEGFVGNVDISYRAVDSAGATYSGTVTVRVYGSGDQTGSGGGNVSYSLSLGQQRTLSAGDFNSASRRVTGSSLSRIRFDSLPSSGTGMLYVNYTGSSSARVTTSTSYYYDSSPRISSITFVPASGYAGTVSIPYTGTDTQGNAFTGNLIFYVGESSTGGTVSYTTRQNQSVSLSAWDFNEACRRAIGTTLDYIRFTSLPSSGAGTLTYGYAGGGASGTRVSTGINYYRSGSPALSSISFVPSGRYTGAVSIPFTGYDADGSRFNGTLRVQVEGAAQTPVISTPTTAVSTASSFSDVTSAWEWARPAIEYLRTNGVTNGYRDNTFRPGRSISRGEFTLMVCRAFGFPTSGASGFPDVPDTSAYAGAIASARNLGIVQGNNGRFQPDRPITRQSAMTMICRALDAAGQSLPAADASILSSFTDGGQVSAFAQPSVAALVQLGAVRGSSSMRLNPGAAISRAEMAVILYRVLTR